MVSAAIATRPVDVRRRRILDRHPGGHQLVVLLLSHDSAHFGELAAAVDAAYLVRVGDGHGFHASPELAKDGHQIGQVIFALGVLARDAADRFEQPLEGERVDPGVDLADAPLFRGRVPLLNNTCNPLAGPDNAPVSVGDVDDRGHNRGGRSRGMVAIDQCLKRLRRQEGDVTRKEDDGSACAEQRGLGHEQRVARAELWLLDHKSESRMPRQC